jgi:lipoyl(octanoyl) transferase
MRELVGARQAGTIGDQVLLLEHPPVITLGSRGRRSHVLDPGEVPVLVDVGRGGDVTYHGPGQRICYPVLLLPEGRRDLHRYLRDLEEVVLRTLATFGLQGERVPGRTGVWVQGEKVAALGVRVARWVTSHGLALNVTRQVHEGFERIIPCGLERLRVTSLEDLLGEPPTLEAIDEALISSLRDVLHL